MNNMSAAAVFGTIIVFGVFVYEAIVWIIENIGRDR